MVRVAPTLEPRPDETFLHKWLNDLRRKGVLASSVGINKDDR